MPKLYVCRHAEAESGPQLDPTRPLTAKGEAQIPVMAHFLQTQTDHVGAVMCSSDLRRGIETGEALAKLLDVPVLYTPWVDPPANDAAPTVLQIKKCWRTILRASQDLEDGQELVVISHGPMVNALAAWLLGSNQGDKFHFSHGSIAHFDTADPATETGYPDQGRGEGVIAYLHWMMSAKGMLRAMEGDDSAVITEALRIADSILGEKGQGSYTYDTVNEKRWVLGDGGVSGNCETCEENADAGWIDDDATFLSVDGGDIDGPPAHPNCDMSGCEIEYRERRVRVYESGRRVTESVRILPGPVSNP